MCWSASSSFIGWILGVFTGGFLFYRRHSYRDSWNACILLVFSTIQLCEFFIWLDVRQGCSTRNQIITSIFIPLVLSVEPLAVIWGSHTLRKQSLLLFYFIWAFILFIIQWDGFRCAYITPMGYLHWNPVASNIFVLLVFALSMMVPVLYFMKPFIIPLLGCAYGSLCILLAYAFTDSVGSNWCILSCGLYMIYILDPYIHNFKTRKDAILCTIGAITGI